MITEAVDQAILKGLKQLHGEIQSQAPHITHNEERISSIVDETAAISDAMARLSNTQRKLQNKVDDLENRSRWNNLLIMGLPESYAPATLGNIQYLKKVSTSLTFL